MGGFQNFVARVSREHRRKKRVITAELLREWPPLLRSRASKGPPPPDSMIIARSIATGEAELGWINYPSGAEGAKRRWATFRPLISDLVQRITRRHFER